MPANGRKASGGAGTGARVAPSLALRSALAGRIRDVVTASGFTQAEAARRLRITQPRLNALLRGKIEAFSLDALVNIATRWGLGVRLAIGDEPAPHPAPAHPATGVTADPRAGRQPASTRALNHTDLAAIPLFASLSPVERADLAQLFTVRSYPKGAVIVAEGEQPDCFNFVLSGHVQPLWRDDAGHQLKLGVDGPGSHFVDAALGGEPVLATFVAITDLEVASFPMTDMTRLLRRHPQLAAVLLLDVVARFRRFLRRAKTLTMESVYGRVVALLLARAKERDGMLVAERMTHVEISHRVGATREMVGRLLRDLVRGGYIRVELGRVTILRKPPARW